MRRNRLIHPPTLPGIALVIAKLVPIHIGNVEITPRDICDIPRQPHFVKRIQHLDAVIGATFRGVIVYTLLHQDASLVLEALGVYDDSERFVVR